MYIGLPREVDFSEPSPPNGEPLHHTLSPTLQTVYLIQVRNGVVVWPHQNHTTWPGRAGNKVVKSTEDLSRIFFEQFNHTASSYDVSVTEAYSTTWWYSIDTAQARSPGSDSRQVLALHFLYFLPNNIQTVT